MTIKIKLPAMAVLLIVSLLSSLFSQTAFAVYFNNESYVFANNCVINFVAKEGINQSSLKMQQASIESIRNGLAFADVFPDSPENSDPHAVLKDYGYFTVNSAYYPIDKSSPINRYMDSLFVYSMNIEVTGVNPDPEIKEITSATVYLGVSWDYSYSINYELNGGTNHSSNPTSYISSKGIGSFYSPSKDYAVFKGWYFDSGFSSPAEKIPANSSGDKTLYAKWENTHSILNFYSDFGEDNKISSEYVPINGKISDYLNAEIPSKDGYSFSGWAKNSSVELSDADVMTDGGFDVYAVWTPNGITAADQTISGVVYGAVVENGVVVENGTGEYTFSLAENETLPGGLSLESDGSISGTFTEAGTFETLITVTDNNSNSQTTAKIVFDIAESSIRIEKMPYAYPVDTDKSLRNSIITGGKFIGINSEGVEEVLDGKLSWKDDSISFKEYGDYTAKVIFTPDNEEYQPIEFDVDITVKKISSSSVISSVSYTIRASASDGGSISPEGKVEVYEYGNQTFSFKADSGYKVSRVIVDGESYNGGETDGKYTFTGVTGSHRISVEFEEIGNDGSKKRFYEDEDEDESSENDKKSSSNNDTAVKSNVDSVFNTSEKIAYIQGYEDGSFKPSNPLTRAEASVILSKILVSEMDDKTYVSEFSDVSPSSWYGAYVCFLTEKGIIDGYEDGTFRPDAYITRAELVSLVVKALGITDSYTNYFSDTAGMWASNAISAVNSFGWIKGYSDGTFRPNDLITRAETTVFLNAVLGRNAEDSSENVSSSFSDVNPSDWFYGSIIEAAGLSDYSL